MPNVFVLVSDQSFISWSEIRLTGNDLSPYPVNNNKPLPPLPIASTTSYWQCANGSCLPSTTVTPYTTQAACTSALVAPPYTGGQCVGVSYNYEFSGSKDNGDLWYNVGYGDACTGSITPYSDADIRAAPQLAKTGALSWSIAADNSVGFGIYNDLLINGTQTGVSVFRRYNVPTNNVVLSTVKLYKVIRVDALADTCGNALSTCPI